jgi:hypothetical protein
MKKKSQALILEIFWIFYTRLSDTFKKFYGESHKYGG